MTRRRSRVTCLIAAAAMTLTEVGTAVAQEPSPHPAQGSAQPGNPTSGDSLFPDVGNRGYDVRHYDIALDFHPARPVSPGSTPSPARAASITATTTIDAVADHALSSVPLDLEGLVVDTVTVDGRPARATRSGHKLVVVPGSPVRGRFAIAVSYHGTPVTRIDPDGALDGWIPTADGATVLSEPVGAMTWFPDNNTPRDKATFRVAVTAPRGLAVAGNGELAPRTTSGGRTTWTWTMAQPMATYLAMISVGRYDVYTGSMRSVDGRTLPLTTFVDPTLGSQARARADVPRAIAFDERQFGPYPFSSAGIVIDRTGAGYALETQSRPTFDGSADTSTIVHELAHQWYGDSVSIRDWGDIWLNEGFATWAEWLFAAANGEGSTATIARAVYREHAAGSAFWRPGPDALTDPADLFSDRVYERGGMTLQALSDRIGRDATARTLRRWAATRAGTSTDTDAFIAVAEQVSGTRLDGLFTTWLDRPSRPLTLP